VELPFIGPRQQRESDRWAAVSSGEDGVVALARARRVGGAPGDSYADRDTVPTDVSLHHHWGRTSTEASYPTIQTHQFRKQPVIVRSMIGFVAIATALYLQLGLIGILYALGFELAFLLIYQLYVAVASLLDSDIC
jgi:hypothetical protein